MRILGVVETALYVDDVDAVRQFYQRVFGFEAMVENERFCALNVADRSVLLLFKKGGTTTPQVIHGGLIPPHDGDGQLHFAFAVSAEELPQWEQRLTDQGVAIEGRVTWPPGGQSIYFRDLDGHLGELATPGIWANY